MRRLAVLLLACVASPVFAGERYVPIEKRLTPDELASVGLTPEQLHKLDDLLAASAARMPTPVVSLPVPRDAGIDATMLKARVRGTVTGWSPGTVFKLDNGQQWAVLKGAVKLAKPVESPSVQLVPGIAGRWFLELDEDHPKARVYRVD